MSAYIADAFVLLGLAGTAIAVLGIIRIPNTYVQVYNLSLAVTIGVLVTLASAVAAADLVLMGKAALIAGFVLLTGPVSGHALARLQSAHEGSGGPEGESPSSSLPAGAGAGGAERSSEREPRDAAGRPRGAT